MKFSVTRRKLRAGSPWTTPSRTTTSLPTLTERTRPGVVDEPSAASVPLAAAGSKLKLRPATCGKRPPTFSTSPTPNSSSACRRAALTSKTQSLLSNLNAASSIRRETVPAGRPASGLADGASSRASLVEPGGATTAPISARMPPPFFSETCTVGSRSRA